MNDTKTLIRSSILSLIIITLGLFLLCIGGTPKINLDEPLVEGGDFESGNDMSDDDFLSLLESADDGAGDDNLNADEPLMFEDDNSAEETSPQEDEELSDILALLDMAENQSNESSSSDDYSTQDDYSSQRDDAAELERLLYDSEESSTENNSGNMDAEAYAELEAEISKLENILKEKDSEVDSIQKSIKKYDNQIAQLEHTKNYPGGSVSNNSSVNYATYDSAPTENNSSSYTSYPAERDYEVASGPFEQQYNSALNSFHEGQYRIAAATFERLLNEDPYNPLADNCQYWIGESNYARGKYFQAICDFEKVFTFDATDKRDDAQIMMGLAYLKAGQVDQARNDFSWLLACYENSEYYQRALRYMDEL